MERNAMDERRRRNGMWSNGTGAADGGVAGGWQDNAGGPPALPNDAGEPPAPPAPKPQAAEGEPPAPPEPQAQAAPPPAAPTWSDDLLAVPKRMMEATRGGKGEEEDSREFLAWNEGRRGKAGRAADWADGYERWGEESKATYRALCEQASLGTGYRPVFDADGVCRRYAWEPGEKTSVPKPQRATAARAQAVIRAEARRRLEEFVRTGVGRALTGDEVDAYVGHRQAARSEKEGGGRGFWGELGRQLWQPTGGSGDVLEDRQSQLGARMPSLLREGIEGAMNLAGKQSARERQLAAVPKDELVDEEAAEELAKRPEFRGYTGAKGLLRGVSDAFQDGDLRKLVPYAGFLFPDVGAENAKRLLERLSDPERAYPLGREDSQFEADRREIIGAENRLAVLSKATGGWYQAGTIIERLVPFMADVGAGFGVLKAAGKIPVAGKAALAAGRKAQGWWDGAAGLAARGGGKVAGRVGGWTGRATVRTFEAVAESAASGAVQALANPNLLISTWQEGNQAVPTFAEREDGTVEVGLGRKEMSFGRAYWEASKELFTEMLGGKLFDPAFKESIRLVKLLRKAEPAAAGGIRASAVPSVRKLAKDWAKGFGMDSMVGEELEEITGRLLDVAAGTDEHESWESGWERVKKVFALDQMAPELLAFMAPGAFGAVATAGEAAGILRARKRFAEVQSRVVGEARRAGVSESILEPFATANSIEEWDEACYRLQAEAQSMKAVVDALAGNGVSERTRRTMEQGMMPQHTHLGFARSAAIEAAEADHAVESVVGRFRRADSEEELREAVEWYREVVAKRPMPASQKAALMKEAKQALPGMPEEMAERLRSARTLEEHRAAFREVSVAWMQRKASGEAEAQGTAQPAAGGEAQGEAEASGEAAARPSGASAETGEAAVQGDEGARAATAEVIERVAAGDESALDEDGGQVMDDEGVEVDLAGEMERMEQAEAAGQESGVGSEESGGAALATQVPGMPTPDVSALSPEARAALEDQARERLAGAGTDAGGEARQDAAPPEDAQERVPPQEAGEQPAAQAESAEETRNRMAGEMREALSKGTVGVAGTDLVEGDIVTLSNGWKVLVGRADEFGRVSLSRKGWNFGNWVQGDETVRVEKVMRDGKDVTGELDEHSKMRTSMRGGVGESAQSEAWTRRAEALRTFGERAAARLPKFKGRDGKEFAVRVVVEGTEGAEIPESVREAYAKQQAERRAEKEKGEKPGFAARGIFERSTKTIYLFEGADDTTLQHEIGHAIRQWAQETSPQLAARFEKLMGDMPEAVVAWARANYNGATEDLIHEEAVAEWLGRGARGVMREILRTESELSWWGRVKKAVAQSCRLALNRLGLRQEGNATEKFDIAALSDADVVKRLFESLLGERMEGKDTAGVEFVADAEASKAAEKKRLAGLSAAELLREAKAAGVAKAEDKTRAQLVAGILAKRFPKPRKKRAGGGFGGLRVDETRYPLLAKLAGPAPWQGMLSLANYKAHLAAGKDKASAFHGSGEWDGLPESARPGTRAGRFLFGNRMSNLGFGAKFGNPGDLAEEEGYDSVDAMWEELGKEIADWEAGGSGAEGSASDGLEAYAGENAERLLAELCQKPYPASGARKVKVSSLKVGDLVVTPFGEVLEMAGGSPSTAFEVKSSSGRFDQVLLDGGLIGEIPALQVVDGRDELLWKEAGAGLPSQWWQMSAQEIADEAERLGVRLNRGDKKPVMMAALKAHFQKSLSAAAEKPEVRNRLREAAFKRAFAGGRAFVDVGDLMPGDRVLTADGTKIGVAENEAGAIVLDGGDRLGRWRPEGGSIRVESVLRDGRDIVEDVGRLVGPHGEDPGETRVEYDTPAPGQEGEEEIPFQRGGAGAGADAGEMRFAGGGRAPSAEETAEAKRQYDEVVARYTNKDGTKKKGWMLAPNGQPTRLKERQWVQVRTENFKRWFGDWEMLAETANPRVVQTVSEAAELVRSSGILNREIENTRLGLTALISGRNLSKMESESATRKSVSPRLHALAIANVDRLFANARVQFSHPDIHGRREVANIRRLGSVLLDPQTGTYVPVLLTVEEFIRDGKRIYSVEAVDVAKYKMNSAGQLAAVADGERQAPIAEFVSSIVRLAADVKSESVSRVVDENGEPLVVWHGSRWNPLAEAPGKAVFDNSKLGTSTGNYGHLGAGHYFSSEETEANGYGKTGGYFLNIRRPFDGSDRAGLEHYDDILSLGEKSMLLDPAEIERAAGNRDPIVKTFVETLEREGHEAAWDAVLKDHSMQELEALDLDTIASDIEFAKRREALTDEQLDYFRRTYGESAAKEGRGYIPPLPYALNTGSFIGQTRAFSAALKRDGHDGIHGGSEFVAFDPTQIKSATDNIGTFDGNNPDIRFSMGGAGRVTQEEDAAYLAAVERGDMETAGRMVRAAAERAGWSDDASWRMDHHAPNREVAEGGAAIRMSDAGTDADGLIPHDAWTHPEWYFNMNDPMERESFAVIAEALREEARHRSAGDGRHATVVMYRGVDKSRNRRESKFRNGDWVTPSRAYALLEARNNPGGGRVIEMRVSLANLYWNGDSISEFGYDNGKDLAYKDTKNNRKLLDPVTRDADGNVIPLSRRFDKNNPSMKFSRGGLYTGSAADYAHRREDGTVENGPSLHKIGTGEGAQVYGWGLYASDVRDVAEKYARIGDWFKGEKKINEETYKAGKLSLGEEAAAILLSEAERESSSWPEMYGKLNFRKAGPGNVALALEIAKDHMETASPRMRGYYKAGIEELERYGKDYKRPSGHLYEQTFFTNRATPEETERHLLKWYEPATAEQLGWIKNAIENDSDGLGLNTAMKGNALRYLNRLLGENKHTAKGGEVYNNIASAFWNSPQTASELLARAGIDGIKFPVDSYGKTVKDGDAAGWNYVSFRDDNIQVDHKWRDGEMVFSRGGAGGWQLKLDLEGKDVAAYAAGKGVVPARRKEMVHTLKRAQRFAEKTRKAWERAFLWGAGEDEWGEAFAAPEAKRGKYPTVSRVLRDLYTRRTEFGAKVKGLRLASAEDVAGMMMALRSPFQEMFKVVFVDGNQRVVDARVVHIGAINMSVVSPLNVLGEVPKGAKGIYLSHNHPSGKPTPSNEDWESNSRMQAAAWALGLAFHDHVVTDGTHYYSMATRTESRLPEGKRIRADWEIPVEYSAVQDIRSGDDVRRIAAATRQGAQVPVVLALGNQNDIRSVRLLPEGFFGRAGERAMVDGVLGNAIETGANVLLLVLPAGTVPRQNVAGFIRRIAQPASVFGIHLLDVIEDGASGALPHSFRQHRPELFASRTPSRAASREPDAGMAYSRGGRLPSTGWPEDFPKIVVHTTRDAIEKGHKADFDAAKAGDADAATRLVRAVCKSGRIRDLAARHPGAIVVPVRAPEATGHNRIPSAFAKALADAGLEMDGGIVQAVRAERTGKDAWYRMTHRPEFDGPVEKGREYVIVDDHVTMGGTLSALRQHIESNGGKVVEIAGLTANQYSTTIALKSDTLALLQSKFGKEIENGLAQANIAESFAALTESEGRYLLKLSPDTLRSRIAEERLSGSRVQDDGLLQRPAGEVDSRFSRGGARTIAERLDEERKAVEARGGRLLLAHHGTDRAGFTVFRDTDAQGFFFAKSRNTAGSYIRSGSWYDIERKGVPDYEEALAAVEYSSMGTGLAVEDKNGELRGERIRFGEGYTAFHTREEAETSARETGGKAVKAKVLFGNYGKLYRNDERIPYADLLKAIQARGRRSGIYDVALKMENPYVLDCHGAKWNNIIDGYEPYPGEVFYRSVNVEKDDHGMFVVRWLEHGGEEKFRVIRDAQKCFDFLKETFGKEIFFHDYENADVFSTALDYANIEAENWAFNMRLKHGRHILGERTRDIVDRAFADGHDGVIFQNVVDNGAGVVDAGADDVYVVKNPNQVKLTDEVTYADDGSIVPADQRLNWDEDDMRFSTGGRGVPEGEERFRPFVLRSGAEVNADPALRALGSWFSGKVEKAQDGTWGIRDGEGRVLAKKIGNAEQARWILEQHQAEMDRSLAELGKMGKAELLEILTARGKFIKTYDTYLRRQRKAAAEMRKDMREKLKAAQDEVDWAEKGATADARDEAKELAEARRKAVGDLREYLKQAGIPREVWSRAVGQFQRIAGARTARQASSAYDAATKFADTVLTTAAVRVLQRKVEEQLKKAEGRETESGVRLKAVTGIPEIRAAYESRESQEEIDKRKSDIDKALADVDLALHSFGDLAGFATDHPATARDIGRLLGIDLAKLPQEDYNAAHESLEVVQRRLMAARDAWENFGGLKRLHGFVVGEAKEIESGVRTMRTAADLARWVQARDRLEAITDETLLKRKMEDAARSDAAKEDRDAILREMGFRNGKRVARTMDEAKKFREGKWMQDSIRKFLMGHMAGGSLAEFLVRTTEGDKGGEAPPGVLEGRMYGLIRTFQECHEEEFRMNERREAEFAELLRRFAGASGDSMEKRVESLERLYQPRKADKGFTKLYYSRDEDGNLLVERGDPITESLAELLPIPLLVRQGEAEAGMSFEEWQERFFQNTEAKKKAAEEGDPVRDSLFRGLMKAGWAPGVARQIEDLHEKAGVGELGAALSRFMDVNFPQLDSMVAWMWGGALTKVQWYCPARRDFVSPDIGSSGDGLGGWMRMMASFLKERRDNGLEINPYNLVDAALAQVRKQNHLLAYYRAVDHARRVFVHRDMQIGMTQQLGEGARNVVNRYLALIAHGERMVNQEQKDRERVLYAVRRACGIAAVVRLSTGIKQMTSALATATFLPKDASVMKFWRDTARIAIDPRERDRFLKEMKANIPDFRWRGKGNIDPLMEDLLTARRGKFNRVTRKVAQVGGGITRWGDRWAVVSGAYGIRNAWLAHLIKSGMAREEAERQAWLRTSAAFNETQQSNMTEFLSVFQQQGGMMSMMLQYMSSPMAISRATVIHWRALLQGRGSKKHHIACLASLVLCQRLFALLSGEIFSWGGGDDDDEWWKRLLRWCGRQAVGVGEATVGATANGLLMGDNSVEYLASLVKGERWKLEAGDLIPAAGALEDALNSIQQLFYGKLSTDAQIRRLANFAGAATGTPLPGAVSIATGAWDAATADDLTPLQRVGRALGYSRRQVGAK